MSRDIKDLKEPFRTGVKKLIKRAKAAGIPVFVTDTTRTKAEQKELVKKGFSQTMDSKHLVGEAVDIAFKVNGKLSYDAALYRRLYDIAVDIPYVAWPYRDYKWFWDKPHFQYDADKHAEVINVKQMFTEIWKRLPAKGEETYFLKRIELGSIEATRYDISEKMKYWYGKVYPNGKRSLLGDLRWQYEKFKVLRGN